MTAGRVLGAIMRFIASCLCVCIILGSVAAVAVSLCVVKETQGDSDLLDLTQRAGVYHDHLQPADQRPGPASGWSTSVCRARRKTASGSR